MKKQDISNLIIPLYVILYVIQKINFEILQFKIVKIVLFQVFK